MANEIERKFLVDNESEVFKELLSTLTGLTISQGYLNTDPLRTVRVRQKGDEGFMTVKGKQVGISKPEWEYPIPLEDIVEMLEICDVKVEKIRFVTPAGNGLVWEIDVFKGLNTGLIIAEIELPSEDTRFEVLDWLGKDVSEDLRFANSNLAIHPYEKWTLEEKAELNVWKKQNPQKEKWENMKELVENSNSLNKNAEVETVSNKVKKML